ncbi:hypothetical protein ACHAL6_15450 [Proteiniclasticum sp. C24MP]|uniref:hypothetical protein n=1 Tax=Proteiniclasticum sp. C24MP TaxID=3374101 RepID=UPI00375471B8
MKKIKLLSRTLQLLLFFTLVLGVNLGVSATEKLKLYEPNRIESEITSSFAYSSTTNKLEKIQTATIDMDKLKVGNNEIYNDGETIISLQIAIPITNTIIQPFASGSSPWSGGSIPTTATLNPRKNIGVMELTYQLDWLNNQIDSIHSFHYVVPLGQATSQSSRIIRPAAVSSLPASAIGELDYVVIQYGIVVGSYNAWLRTEINRYNQLRLVWNM